MTSLSEAIRRNTARGHFLGLHGAVSQEKFDEVLAGGSFKPTCVQSDAEFSEILKGALPELAQLLEEYPKLEMFGVAVVTLAHRKNLTPTRVDFNGKFLINRFDELISRLLELTGSPLNASLRTGMLTVDAQIGGRSVRLQFHLPAHHDEDMPVVTWAGGNLSMNKAGAALLLNGTYKVGLKARPEELKRASQYFLLGYVASLPGNTLDGNIAIKSGSTILGFRGTRHLGGYAFVSEMQLRTLPGEPQSSPPVDLPFIGYVDREIGAAADCVGILCTPAVRAKSFIHRLQQFIDADISLEHFDIQNLAESLVSWGVQGTIYDRMCCEALVSSYSCSPGEKISVKPILQDYANELSKNLALQTKHKHYALMKLGKESTKATIFPSRSLSAKKLPLPTGKYLSSLSFPKLADVTPETAVTISEPKTLPEIEAEDTITEVPQISKDDEYSSIDELDSLLADLLS